MKRAILDQLTAKELRAEVDNFELHVDDRRVKAQLAGVLADSRKVRLDDLLTALSRNRLKALCRVFGLDDSGRSKADLVARLAGSTAASKGDGGQAPPSGSRPRASRPHARHDARGNGDRAPPAVSRPAAKTPAPPAGTQGATTGHEADLWRMADALRGSMDAAEYKHVVLGLIFLKYISDAFEEMHARLEAERDEGADPEDPDEYRAENIFWVPPEARWSRLKAQARQPDIGRLVDDAMTAIERDNSGAQGRAAQGLRPTGARQAAARPAHRHDQQHPGGRRGRPLQGRARPRLRVLPLAVRECRGQEGRRVLHPALRRQAPGRDAGTLAGTGLRPLLRLVGDVRAVGGVHPRARHRQWERRQGARRHLRVRPGVELHDVAACPDEPRHPRHRGPDRARRHLPRRQAPRSPG